MPRLTNSLNIRDSYAALIRGGDKNNVCITVGSDAVGAGFYYPAYGSVVPTHADNGVRFYQFTWYTNGSSSSVTFAFGDAGNSVLDTDIHDLIITIFGKTYDAHWDESNTHYYIVDQTLVDELVLLSNGDELCFYIGAVPDNYILYDFDVMIGDRGC